MIRPSLTKTILLSLAFINETLTEVSDPLGIKYRYKHGNRKMSLYRLKKRKLIEKVKKGNYYYIQLTEEGSNTILKILPLINFQSWNWDKKWRLVAFDIEELSRFKRDRLRKKLKELGFAACQKSLYINALPVENMLSEFLVSHNLESNVKIFISDIVNSNPKQFAESLWNLSEINDQYRQIIEEYGNDPNRALKMYFKTLSSDPFLPKELLPDNWQGGNARNIVLFSN